ncbi:MAG: hypothetical protein M3Y33_05425 [Actinomycetota bacterium]|nr:hypothetical protein [Actinomycetota bacterium]
MVLDDNIFIESYLFHSIHAQLPGHGTVAQAAKMPMVAVTPTEVLEAMHHCMPSEEYPYSTSRACPK